MATLGDREDEERIRALIERASAKRRTGLSVALGAGAYPTIAVIVSLLIWEIATDLFSIPKFILPAPSVICRTMIEQWSLLADHSLVTIFETCFAVVMSVIIGIPLAVAMTYFRPLERAFYPLLVSAQTIPKVAIAPVFVVWFGFGLTPKVLIAFLIAFFPIVISTAVGLRACPPELLYLTNSMGASAWQKFRFIRFPIALPSIFGGLKVAVTLAVVGALVGEFVGASRGLGYLIQTAGGNMDTRLLFAAIAAASIVGILLFLAVDIVERHVLRWHVSARLEQLVSM